MNMKLEHLRAFEAVARVGHFTKAAEELFMAQPSLSRQIAGLEADLGQDLFDRGRNGATLTHAGEVLLPIARRMLADAETAQAEMNELAGLSRGRVRLGAPPTLCVSVVAEVLSSFRAAHPGVALEVMEAGSHALAQALSEGRLDLALTVDRGPVGAPVSSESLFTEELVVASARAEGPLGSQANDDAADESGAEGHPGDGAGEGGAAGAPGSPAGEPGAGGEAAPSGTHAPGRTARQVRPATHAAGLGRAALFLGTGAPDARDGNAPAPAAQQPHREPLFSGERLSLAELAELPLVAFNRSYDLRVATDAAFAAAGLEPSVAVEGAEMDAVLRFVERGIGVAVVPATILMERPGLRATRLVEPALTRTAALSVREGGSLDAAARAMRELVLETVERLTRPGTELAALVARA
ncbi:LysR family transcriptional regulator [Galactobacter valiniphilus]|nr:LysR substrate-binding domain-containing protein [Galactobacter valiniphilus]